MEPAAAEMVRTRKQPSHPELMRSLCPILDYTSVRYPSCVHGYSTTLMASMFKFEYLFANLPAKQMCDLLRYIATGTPVQRSAHDGLCGSKMSAHVSAHELEAYLEDTFGAHARLAHEPAAAAPAAASDADGAMTGFEMLDEEDLDMLISSLDEYADAPAAPTVEVPGLEEASDNEGDGSSVRLVTPVAEGGAQPRAQTPLPQECKYPSIAKKLKTVPAAPPTHERRHWSSVEDDLILVYYEKHGAKWRDMARVLATETRCSRSDDALRNRHYRLTAHSDETCSSTSSDSVPSARKPVPRRVSWSQSEDELILGSLAKIDDRFTWQRLSELLPSRTTHAIRNRASRLFMERERLQLVHASPREASSEASESS